ncbi:hypothetical protein KsCSTR_06110 [Candidatus Kuenenia stuttgartiensis]|jgi:predicted  nucleic acid-binding Zn-ribbon protein|uniref:Uncharacterized protein n=1 Tax=Kuenenia stuttgartiensis TaxID=174633 RepID=Q1PZY2_KUEST|nr:MULTISPECIES: hypothetical protein [Kuenenia]MCL4726007.1 hypothetical protein [Candidatus Kuenenia stuttgartiensis]MCZ7621756.1 hypothetical protein [Candidatus Kuenenia sp.]QII09990.1 hypothetical protein KsCSTR_06110 [Candidatus Kuenenia stuttgartiensis]TVM02059.1 MAG: hypothetical protein CV080_02200 [Candidatus Kuenenia stuttgartiensis]CAJ72632.1 hypothetical protein kustd1887 [Candidatus Kuenenia stuttgartiensis]
MKHWVYIAVLLVFIYLPVVLFVQKSAIGQTSGQEVFDKLTDFQKSLRDWMRNIDNLSAQFSELNKDVKETIAPLKESSKIIKDLEGKMNKIVSRLEKVEQVTSIEDVKNTLDSFGKTFDVFKKLFSDLKKRVEDQEVKTTVLEKKYQEAETPLAPFKKALEDINKLVTDKFAEQEKILAAAEVNIKTRTEALDQQIKIFEEFDRRVKNLERRGVVSSGTATAAVVVASPEVKVTPVAEAVGTETVVAAKEEPVAREPSPEEEGFNEAGEGFYVRNVKLLPFGSSAQIEGEIKNLSGKDQSIANFEIKVYDKKDLVLFMQDFSIRSFKNEAIRKFNEIITGYSPVDIARYEVLAKRRY